MCKDTSSRYLVLNDVSNSSTKRQYKELILYDGFMMQRLFETMINENESNTDHVHIVFEDRLICTFSEEDLHYHARTIVGGNSSIIFTTGIVEAPAKPKEWYIKQMQLATYDIDRNIANIDAEGIEHHIHPETLKKLEVFVSIVKNSHEFGMMQGSKR
jgi:hypothetical protein